MDVACFCGFRYRLVGDLGLCPGCGDYVTLGRVSDAEASQMRAELDVLLAAIVASPEGRGPARRRRTDRLPSSTRTTPPADSGTTTRATEHP